jgi:hypothetical protein
MAVSYLILGEAGFWLNLSSYFLGNLDHVSVLGSRVCLMN